MPVIYIDVLFLINFILDSSLLLLTGRLSGKLPHPIKILLGGSLGGIYSCAVFFVNLPVFCSFIIKILVSAAMIFIAFYPFSAKDFIRFSAAFYLQTFLLGGALSALFYFSGRPAVMSNNVYYFPFSTVQLLFVALPLMTALYFYWKKSRNRLLSCDKYCTVTISHGGKTLTAEGLIDSGCSLCDPLSGKPVIILSAKLSEKLFDAEKVSLIKQNEMAKLLTGGGFTLIPFSTLTSTGGNMVGFSPDLCKINTAVCDCVIAFSATYSDKTAIINPDVLIFGGTLNEL